MNDLRDPETFERAYSHAPWEKSVGYCRALRAGNQIFVTGTAPITEEGKTFAPQDAYAQAQRCLELIEQVLESFGANRRNIARTRLFVTDIERWQEYGRAHREFFEAHRPATSMVEVGRLIDPEMLIEIEADAIVLDEPARQASPSLEVTGVNHITFAVTDLERSFLFYSQVLGMRPAARWSCGAYLEAGKDWFALITATPPLDPKHDYTHVALSVEPRVFGPLAKRIKDSGAQIWQENRSEGPSLYFTDPDGHRLELHASDLAARVEVARAEPWDPELEVFHQSTDTDDSRS